MCAEDRRGVYVRLTDAGKERHTAARPTQLAVLAQHLGTEASCVA
jgi:DNA-binding MarR family transcriptional regulator